MKDRILAVPHFFGRVLFFLVACLVYVATVLPLRLFSSGPVHDWKRRGWRKVEALTTTLDQAKDQA